MSAFWKIVLVVLGCGILLTACAGEKVQSLDGPGSDDAAATDDDNAAGDDSGDDAAADDYADDDGVDRYPETCFDGPVFDFDIESDPIVAPYPNNLFTVPDPSAPTGLRVNVGEDTTRPLGLASGVFGWWMDALNELDGFSTLGYLFVPTGEKPKGATLPDRDNPGIGDGVFLMVIDESSPYFGEFARLDSWWMNHSIRLQPWVPLHERTRYALVATRALRLPFGSCYRASDSMRRIYHGYVGDTPPEEWTGTRYLPVLDILAQQGLDPANILSISEFTTLSVTKGMDDARAVLDGLAADSPPVLANWTLEGAGDPGLFGFAKATLHTPIFKNAETHSWVYNEDGNLNVDHWEDVPALFSIPAEDANPRGQPYPVIIFGHGILSSKGELQCLAGRYAQAGLAFAAIDAVCHGERYTGDDGTLGEGLCFYDLVKPLGWRDNWRETVANYMWLVRAVRQLGDLDLDDNGIPDFDVTHIYYQGHSMGTLMGGILAAVETNIDAYVMDSAGGDFISIGLEGPYAGPYLDAIATAQNILPAIKAMDFVEDAGVMAQHALDQADPANFINHTSIDKIPALADKDIYILQQGAAYDYTLGGVSGGYYCRAGGWPQIEPFVWDVDAPHAQAPYEGSGFVQFEGDEHSGICGNDALGAALREQATHYFNTQYENGVAEIVNAFE